ncbi:MAG: hypothetical protein QXH96_00270 [Candidatus Geothermarchaeota archaeon]
MSFKNHSLSSISAIAEKIFNLFTPYSKDIEDRIIMMKKCGYEGFGIVYCSINDLKNIDLIHNICSKEGVVCFARFHFSNGLMMALELSRDRLLRILRKVRNRASLVSIDLSLASLLKISDLNRFDIVTLNLPSIRLLQKYVDKIEVFELTIDNELLDIHKIGKFIPIIRYLLSMDKLIISQNISNMCIPPLQLCIFIHGLLGLKHVDCKVLYKKPFKLLM